MMFISIARKPVIAAMVALAAASFGGASTAVAQDTCDIREDRTLATTPVLDEICPPGIASVAGLLTRPGAGGQENRDLRVLSGILARATQAPQTLSEAEAERLSRIFNENATIRVGLQVAILSNLFDAEELLDWCQWRRDGETAGFTLPTDDALEVESVLQCYDFLE